MCRDLLIPEGHTQQTGRDAAEPQRVRAGAIHRPHAAKLLTSSPISDLTGTVRFDLAALDAWFEEDEPQRLQHGGGMRSGKPVASLIMSRTAIS